MRCSPTARSAWFGEVPGNFTDGVMPQRYGELVTRMRALHRREAEEIERRFPKVLRRVGGYNIDSIDDNGHNMARLLVGSEGTLAFFNEIELELQPIPAHRVLGICHFPSFYGAMASTRRIVELGPSAVELVDRTMIELSREIAMFRPVVERFVRGEPAALLLTEFSGDDPAENFRRLKALGELMGDLGYPGAVVEAIDPAFQQAVWEVRASGLNIMMSMKGDGKPVSFLEDCAVELEDLADYTERLTRIFEKHGTYGTWYAHASVGCLHVRPVLNLKQEIEVRKMRAIAEEAFAMVREYKGSHSGEHGDGLVRSEFHEQMFGGRLVRAFEEVKDAFDPQALFNPGKIVRATKMDDRSLFRYRPDYRQVPVDTALDWSEWGGFAAASEMCNNNGACRTRDAGVMCPSYRATGDEQHLTRGRANTLRLALSGQLGPEALAAEEMRETLDLCIACKGCKRECPTGVDMARMKIEFLHHYRKRHGLTPRDRLIAYLPRYAPHAARIAPLVNLRNRVPLVARLGEKIFSLSAKRSLPSWSAHPYAASDFSLSAPGGGEGRGEVGGAQGSEQRRDPPHPPGANAPGPSPDRVGAALSPKAGGEGRRRAIGSGAAGRHLQPLFRAGECSCRRARVAARRLPRRQRRPGERPAVVLRADLSLGRAGRRGAAGGASNAGRPCASPRGGNADHRARTVLPADLARRIPGHSARRPNQSARRARPAVRGIRRNRAGGRPLPARLGPDEQLHGVAARALSSEGVRHPRRSGQGVAADPGPHRRDLRLDLLRDGRILRLRGRAL